MQDQLITVGLKVAMGAGLFILFVVIGSIVKRIVIKMGINFELDQNIANLLGRTLKVIIILIGIISSLGTMGINVSALVAGLGLTGFALGYALKDSISNLLAGIMILLYRPFQINDKIDINGIRGIVKHIDLRYTTLDNETSKILIPNSKLFTDPISVLK